MPSLHAIDNSRNKNSMVRRIVHKYGISKKISNNIQEKYARCSQVTLVHHLLQH
jgi:hypothetical protein